MENEKIKSDNGASWLLGSIVGIVVGVVAWLLIIFLSARLLPIRFDELLFFVSFPISAFIAGFVSYRIGKNLKIAIVTGILTIPIDFFVAILLFAMAGGGMR